MGMWERAPESLAPVCPLILAQPLFLCHSVTHTNIHTHTHTVIMNNKYSCSKQNLVLLLSVRRSWSLFWKNNTPPGICFCVCLFHSSASSLLVLKHTHSNLPANAQVHSISKSTTKMCLLSRKEVIMHSLCRQTVRGKLLWDFISLF